MTKKIVVYYFESGDEEGTMNKAYCDTDAEADYFIELMGSGIEVFDVRTEYGRY
jgi:hypothetical protein